MSRAIYGRAFQTTRNSVNLKFEFCLDYTGETVFNGKNYADVKDQAIRELRKQKFVGKVKFVHFDPKRLA